MKKICLSIEYDGTGYVGWQTQPNGTSVQEVMENALAQIAGENIRLHSSGRTDAGVHALGMRAHFTTGKNLPLSAFREGVNGLLPSDIAVRRAEFVDDDFHARFNAVGKWYRYTLYVNPVRSPLYSRYSWHLRAALDISLAARVAQAFVGEHDFASFRTSGCAAQTTVREVFSVDLLPEGDLVHIDVRGSGFLKNMVRMMAGTLVEVGQGKRPPSDVERLLEGGEGGKPARTAPPQGLCLVEVFYSP